MAVGHCRAVVGQGDLAQCHLLAVSDIVGGYGGGGGGSKFGTMVVPKWSKGPKTKVVGNCLKRGDMWSVLVCADQKWAKIGVFCPESGLFREASSPETPARRTDTAPYRGQGGGCYFTWG